MIGKFSDHVNQQQVKSRLALAMGFGIYCLEALYTEIRVVTAWFVETEAGNSSRCKAPETKIYTHLL